MNVRSGSILLMLLLLALIVPPVACAGEASPAGGQSSLGQVAQGAGKNLGVLAQPYIAFDMKTVEPGNPFDYSIMVYNVEDLANMDLVIDLEGSRDSMSYLKCTKVNKGSFIGNALFDSQIGSVQPEGTESARQKITVSFASSIGARGSGPIVTLSCVVEKSMPDGGVIVLPSDFTSSSSTGEDIPWKMVYAGVISTGKPSKGDCDGDGYASTRDALMVIQMSVGKQETDLTCDVNGDGKVNSADAREILKFAQSGGTAAGSTLQAGAVSGLGSGNAASGEGIAPIPLPNPQNLGIGGTGSEKLGVTPITIPRFANTGSRSVSTQGGPRPLPPGPGPGNM